MQNKATTIKFHLCAQFSHSCREKDLFRTAALNRPRPNRRKRENEERTGVSRHMELHPAALDSRKTIANFQKLIGRRARNAPAAWACFSPTGPLAVPTFPLPRPTADRRLPSGHSAPNASQPLPLNFADLPPFKCLCVIAVRYRLYGSANAVHRHKCEGGQFDRDRGWRQSVRTRRIGCQEYSCRACPRKPNDSSSCEGRRCAMHWSIFPDLCSWNTEVWPKKAEVCVGAGEGADGFLVVLLKDLQCSC